jgi:hypothetical protein
MRKQLSIDVLGPVISANQIPKVPQTCKNSSSGKNYYALDLDQQNMIFNTMQDKAPQYEQKYSQKASYQNNNNSSKDRNQEEKSRGHPQFKKEHVFNILSGSNTYDRISNTINDSNEKKKRGNYYAERALQNSKEFLISKDKS